MLVYGATTFRAFREFVAEYDEPYYESLNALPKIVFSSTLQEPLGWSNSTVIAEDAVAAMARLKRGPTTTTFVRRQRVRGGRLVGTRPPNR